MAFAVIEFLGLAQVGQFQLAFTIMNGLNADVGVAEIE